MRNMKRSLTILLIAAMVFSSIGATFADTKTNKFTDIDKSWAKQYIINATNKGLLEGATETLFKPTAVVTQYQALVSIAKVARASEKYDLAALEKEYKVKYLDPNNVPANIRKEISFCLKTGIVKPGELASFKTVPNVTKQVVSIYLGRAFGIVYDPAKPAVVLKYADAIGMIKESFPHINYLVNLGVFDAPKTSTDKFNPNTAVTKEVMAKILDVASNKYNELNPPTSSTSNPVTPPTPTVPETPATPTTPITPTPTTPVTPAPTPTTPVEPTTPDVTIPPANPGSVGQVESDTIAANYTGTVDWVFPEYGVIVFIVNGAQKTYAVANDMQCIVDGIEGGQYWKLKQGDKASMYIKDNKISKLEIVSKVKKVSGVLDKSTDKGTVEAIVFSRTAPAKIIISRPTGQRVEYYTFKAIEKQNIIIQGREASLYDLRAGMQVNLDIENQDVTKLATFGTVGAGNLEGTITSVNTKAMIVTIESFDAVQLKNVEKIVYAATAKIGDRKSNLLTLTQLKIGDKIIVLGSNDINGIIADTITLNN